MFQEQIVKVYNMSLFESPWQSNTMAAYVVCETDTHRKVMILFKTLDSNMRIDITSHIYGGWLCQREEREIELTLRGHSYIDLFSIFDLDTGEELNGKN